jgi:phospholipid transport system transporter-binding protein
MAVWPLPATATLLQARAVQDEVSAAIARCGPEGLQIDAAALADFDTSLIALLLHAQRTSRARGVPLQVTGAPPKLADLARLYGVAELLPLDGVVT